MLLQGRIPAANLATAGQLHHMNESLSLNTELFHSSGY